MDVLAFKDENIEQERKRPFVAKSLNHERKYKDRLKYIFMGQRSLHFSSKRRPKKCQAFHPISHHGREPDTLLEV